MTFDQIAAIGELLGGIGVIVSLIYLGRQVGFNSKLGTLSARQQLSESVLMVMLAPYQNHELAKAVARERDGEPLSSVDEVYLTQLKEACLRVYQNSYGLYREGVLPEREWESVRADLTRLIAIGFLRERTDMIVSNHRQGTRTMYTPEFSEQLMSIHQWIDRHRVAREGARRD